MKPPQAARQSIKTVMTYHPSKWLKALQGLIELLRTIKKRRSKPRQLLTKNARKLNNKKLNKSNNWLLNASNSKSYKTSKPNGHKTK